jgi:hypothetical protein
MFIKSKSNTLFFICIAFLITFIVTHLLPALFKNCYPIYFYSKHLLLLLMFDLYFSELTNKKLKVK